MRDGRHGEGEVETRSNPLGLTDSEAEDLVSMRLADPHALLGLHAIPDGFLLRVFRPGAEQVRVEFLGRTQTLHQVHGSGIFETVLPGQARPFSYLLEAVHPGGSRSIYQDPYAFVPALGESGFRPSQSGRQEDAWNRMGAHEGSFHGVPGVAFAAWEPQAAGVSVAGDFNGWNGRTHQLRRTAVTGLWEIFIPGVPAWVKYRFEVRRAEAPMRLP